MARTKDSPQILELRKRLLHAAGEIFADRGFQAATVREITEKAGVNIAAVNYHFRDKAELYACVLSEAQAKADRISLPTPEDGTPAQRLRVFVGSMLTYLLDPERPAWQSRLMARELAEPTVALDRVVDSFRRRCDCLLGIVEDAAGAPLAREKLVLLGNSVMAQCLHYSQCGPVIRRLFPEIADYATRIDLLAEHITGFTLPGIKKAGRDALPSSTHEQRREARPTRRENQPARSAIQGARRTRAGTGTSTGAKPRAAHRRQQPSA